MGPASTRRVHIQQTRERVDDILNRPPTPPSPLTPHHPDTVQRSAQERLGRTPGTFTQTPRPLDPPTPWSLPTPRIVLPSMQEAGETVQGVEARQRTPASPMARRERLGPQWPMDTRSGQGDSLARTPPHDTNLWYVPIVIILALVLAICVYINTIQTTGLQFTRDAFGWIPWLLSALISPLGAFVRISTKSLRPSAGSLCSFGPTAVVVDWLGHRCGPGDRPAPVEFTASFEMATTTISNASTIARELLPTSISSKKRRRCSLTRASRSRSRQWARSRNSC